MIKCTSTLLHMFQDNQTSVKCDFWRFHAKTTVGVRPVSLGACCFLPDRISKLITDMGGEGRRGAEKKHGGMHLPMQYACILQHRIVFIFAYFRSVIHTVQIYESNRRIRPNSPTIKTFIFSYRTVHVSKRRQVHKGRSR